MRTWVPEVPTRVPGLAKAKIGLVTPMGLPAGDPISTSGGNTGRSGTR